MRMVVYGLPCAGKDTLIDGVPFAVHVRGSAWLEERSKGRFGELPEREREALRAEFIEYVRETEGELVVVDGHLSFPEGDGYRDVITEADRGCYDVFAYLDVPVGTIIERIKASPKNASYAGLSEADLAAWREHELDLLTDVCMERRRDLLQLDSDAEAVSEFLRGVLDGRIHLAQEIAEVQARRILKSTDMGTIALLDGDKTVSERDIGRASVRDSSVFDGDRYSTYQFWKARRGGPPHPDADPGDPCLFAPLLDDMSRMDAYRVVVTAGSQKAWKAAVRDVGCIDDVLGPSDVEPVSRMSKAFLCLLLQDDGRKVVAMGDNMADLPMLECADRGYAVASRTKSASLQVRLSRGNKLRQPSYNRILFDDVEVIGSVHEDVVSMR